MEKTKTEAVIMAKDSQRKKDFDKQFMVFVAFKLFRRTDKGENDQAIIDFLDGKNKSAVIKTALREYMERHPKEYRYGMRLRGFSPGAQPKGVLRREDDTTGKYHDILVYARQLSADEIADYELDDLN